LSYVGRSPRFCSRECYSESAWTQRQCFQCGRFFRARKVYVNRGQMSYCSPKCGQIAGRKRHAIEIDGLRFTLSVGGYYVSTDNRSIKLHRYLWEKANGPVPDGCVVHHKNEIKTDNRLENLEVQKWADHTAEHSRERWKSGVRIGKGKKHFICDDPKCERPSKARGLCTRHYQRVMAKERGRWL
jgi:hypothetical protein